VEYFISKSFLPVVAMEFKGAQKTNQRGGGKKETRLEISANEAFYIYLCVYIHL